MKLGMRKLTTLIGAVTIAVFAPLAHAIPVELVTDGDFEANNTDTVWNVTAPAFAFATPSRSGNSSILFGNDAGPGSIFQSLSVTNAATYDFEFFLHGNVSNFSALLDSKDLFTDPNTDTDPVDTDGWTRYFGSIGLTAGSHSLTFAGSPARQAFNLDDVSISADIVACTPGVDCPTNPIPEPGTLALVGAALAAGAVVRRRKQHQI